jgi:diaminopimelate decarboxylase
MFDKQTIEKFSSLTTPFYYYDLNLLDQNLIELKKISAIYGYKIHYALKANADEKILKKIKDSGFGADCVSGNEVKKSLDCGFPRAEIVFAGVGKTDQEIFFALENNIFCLNCESLQELEVVNSLAKNMNKTATIALRLNPNLDAETHHYITTGREENKFGIPHRDIEHAVDYLKDLSNLNLIGLHFHIGSQISNMEIYKNLCLAVNELQIQLSERGISLSHLNLGGGLGVDYENPDDNPVPDYGSFFQTFKQYLNPLPGQTVHFELGRALVGQCGTLISRVLYVKKGIATQFAVIDAGMTELIRPALYQAYHKIENLTSSAVPCTYDVVGPVCESADFLGKAVRLPETKRGDLLAIRTAGAYARVMASQYNMREPAKVVYSDEI